MRVFSNLLGCRMKGLGFREGSTTLQGNGLPQIVAKHIFFVPLGNMN